MADDDAPVGWGVTLDHADAVALVGFCSIVGIALVANLPAVAVSALLGGFLLSLATWSVYRGRPWEALGWFAWLGAAVAIAVVVDGQPAIVVIFLVSILAGLVLLFGGRFGYLPPIWTDEPGGEDASTSRD